MLLKMSDNYTDTMGIKTRIPPGNPSRLPVSPPVRLLRP